MDYEKKYNEALERAQKAIRAGGDVAMEIVQHIFPELRESEDERIRKALIDALKVSETIGELKFRLPYSTREECIAYLEKQKEQKPAEWSEEDRDILNCCISSIEEAKENRYAYKETDGDTSYDREIAWLKSLRPRHHWRPSEEQMRALKVAFRKDGDDEYRNIINSLYNDLIEL